MVGTVHQYVVPHAQVFDERPKGLLEAGISKDVVPTAEGVRELRVHGGVDDLGFSPKMRRSLAWVMYQ